MFLSGSFAISFVMSPAAWSQCSESVKFKMSQGNVPEMFPSGIFAVFPSICPWYTTFGNFQSHFGNTASTSQGNWKLGIFWMYLQCSQSVTENYQMWYTMGILMGTLQICHLGTFRVHCPGSFWILLTRNTVIRQLGTSQRKLQMSHSGTSQVLSLGKFKVNPLIT